MSLVLLRKKKALQRIRWIKDSVFAISAWRYAFWMPAGCFFVEYSMSFTWKFILESAQLQNRSNTNSFFLSRTYFVKRSTQSIEEHQLWLRRSSGLTNNHRFIGTELFRMVQGPHSSGNFKDWTVEIEKPAVKYENLNGRYSRCVTFRLFKTIRRVAR